MSLFVCSILTMVAMETGHFIKMLNDASLASLGLLMWKVLGCIICKNPLWVLSCKVNLLGYLNINLFTSTLGTPWSRPVFYATLASITFENTTHQLFVTGLIIGHFVLTTKQVRPTYRPGAQDVYSCEKGQKV